MSQRKEKPVGYTFFLAAKRCQGFSQLPNGCRTEVAPLWSSRKPLKPHVPHQFLLVRRRGLGVAIGIEQELGVAVDGDESLDVSMALHKVHDGFHLGL